MSKKSDQHEKNIAQYLNSLADVESIRPIASTGYSDVQITYNNASTWLEVKMSHKDNLVNPRVYYHENTWKTRYSTPVAGFIVGQLNKSETARDFVYTISDYCGLAYESIYIPTNKSEMDALNTVPRDKMRSFCKIHSGYIMNMEDYDVSSLVTSHYTLGKKEPAYYMQAGDDFFMISNTNPLGLSSDIPEFKGIGRVRVRVSNRSKFYEIQAEVKVQSIETSNYSVLPNTKKINPFL